MEAGVARRAEVRTRAAGGVGGAIVREISVVWKKEEEKTRPHRPPALSRPHSAVSRPRALPPEKKVRARAHAWHGAAHPTPPPCQPAPRPALTGPAGAGRAQISWPHCQPAPFSVPTLTRTPHPSPLAHWLPTPPDARPRPSFSIVLHDQARDGVIETLGVKKTAAALTCFFFSGISPGGSSTAPRPLPDC